MLIEYYISIDLGDWTISLKSNAGSENIVRNGSFAFEGINENPKSSFQNSGLFSKIVDYEAGNVTGILVRRKFVGKLGNITFNIKPTNITINTTFFVMILSTTIN